MVWLPSQIITLKKERVGARGGEAPEVGRAERAIGVVGGATPQRNNIISYIIVTNRTKFVVYTIF